MLRCAAKKDTSMFTVSSGFIAIFKTGDNINYNLRILRLLYNRYANASNEDRRLLCKPITVIFDFDYRSGAS